MGLWDFVKDAGKSVFGGAAEAAEPKPAEGKTPEQQDTDRKVEALKGELRRLGLGNNDVHLTLRGDTVKIESKGADRETMEKLILAVGNIKGIAKVEADLPPAPVPAGAAAAAEPARTTEAAPANAEPVFYTVKKGDTLSAIAKQHLGDANKYRVIFEANKPMLKDPDEIYPGQQLRIPQA